jgi:serine/threonine protein kinase
MRATLIDEVPFVEVALLEPGSRFGAYVIEHPVGAGGMAVVWKARHTALGRTVALKVLRAEASPSPSASKIDELSFPPTSGTVLGRYELTVSP